jgi:hypothetical protein
MKVTFSVVPPGGGEAEEVFEAKMPALPLPEDYVLVKDEEARSGMCWKAFIVRRRWFWPQESEGDSIRVEVEVARHSHESANHKRICEKFQKRGKPIREMQTSCY